MEAYLKNYRQAPRKVRLVTDLVRGKHIDEALATLEFVPKRASYQIKKLISSAAANAVANHSATRADLYIKEIRVDKGTVMKRSMPVARGSSHPIHKHMSHVRVTLATGKPIKVKRAKKTK